MPNRLRLTVLLLLVTAVFAITTRVVSTQPQPPRPPHLITEMPHLPGDAEVPAEMTQPAEAVPAVILPWSLRTFQSYRDENWEIYTSNDDGSNEMRRTEEGAIDMHPRLNRGATRIAFSSKRDGSYEIYTMNVDGSSVTRLTFTVSDNVYPAWSPDGSKIAFQSYRDGQTEIYVMNADGSAQTRLTNHGSFDGYPTWSPDGSKIAFSSSRAGQYYIHVMNADGSGVTQLSSQLYSLNPVWSPDGSKIAYDADLDNDGWQELWVMDANGANQQMKYNPSGQTDAWVHSWSPDSFYVTFTRIQFIYYQGVWYWVNAYLEICDLQQGTTARLSNSGLDWNPDWQTADAVQPTVSIGTLPHTSPAPITVNWAGGDAGGSGFRSYDVQVKVGNGGNWVSWLNNTQDTSATYAATSGQTYAFRVQARDNAHNLSNWTPDNQAVTTIEAWPPQTAVAPIPPFTHINNDLSIIWGGTDDGHSGIASYDVQYRLNNASWNNWLTEITLTSANLQSNGLPGDVIDLRSRGRDVAHNLESWPAVPDTSTTLYQWGITGQVHDNTNTPVGGATIQTTPLAFHTPASDREGAFGSYVTDASTVYSVTISKSGYGSLPETGYDFVPDPELHTALPPANNLVGNAFFETGTLSPTWMVSGNRPPTISDYPHTGEWSAFMGQQATDLGPQFPIIADGTINRFVSVLDTADNLHFIWFAETSIQHQARLADGSWSSLASIYGVDIPYNMAAVADKNGDIHVVWTVANYTNDILYARWRKSSNTWSVPVNILQSYASSQQPQIAVGVDGRVHTVWTNYLDGSTWVMYARQETNGTWSPPVQIVDDFGQSQGGSVMTDAFGRAYLLWQSTDSHNANEVRYAQVTPNGVTGPITTIIDANLLNWSYEVEENGQIHLAWTEMDDSSTTNLYYRFWNGEYWSAPGLPLFSEWLSSMDMALGPEGAVGLVWQGDGSVYYRQKDIHSGWGELAVLGASETIPVVTMDVAGLAHVIWSGGIYDDMPQGDMYYTRQLPGGDEWTTPVRLSSADTTQRTGTVIADSTGYIHTAWLEGTWDEPRSLMYRGSLHSASAESAVLATAVHIPADMPTPILSYQYQIGGMSSDRPSSLTVAVQSAGVTTTLQTYQNWSTGWQHDWADLSPWVGETVSITFALQQGANAPLAWVYLDSVTVGSALPDVWVAATADSGLPGEQMTQTLIYGNRGGAVAAGTRLTYTLPAKLSFVSASIPPVSTSPLVWDLGDLPAKSEPFALSVVVAISPTAVLFNTLSSTAVIHLPAGELEMLNNQATGQTFIGQRIFLPVVRR